MRLASVDIGTNTVRLLIADVEDGRLKLVHQDRAVVRLGENLASTGLLKKEAMDRTIKALLSFKEACERYDAEKVIPIATAAVREAKNGGEFVRLVKELTGWDVRVISGEEEAYYTYLGVKAGLNIDERTLIFDIGGGSTEYICASESLKYKSLKMGVMKLTETFVKSDPPEEGELQALREEVRRFLCGLDMRDCSGLPVIGTAGTPTTLAALDMKLEIYDPEKVHGYRLSLKRLEEMLSWLSSMKAQERLRLPGMEKGREDLIIAGCVITVETLKYFQSDTLVVSEWGIREGVIVAEAGKQKDKPLQGSG